MFLYIYAICKRCRADACLQHNENNQRGLEINMDRSLMFSILKCEFGWNGCTSSGFDWDFVDSLIAKHKCTSRCANEVAILLAEHGEIFLERCDGKPNKRIVVNGVVEINQ